MATAPRSNRRKAKAVGLCIRVGRQSVRASPGDAAAWLADNGFCWTPRGFVRFPQGRRPQALARILRRGRALTVEEQRDLVLPLFESLFPPEAAAMDFQS